MLDRTFLGLDLHRYPDPSHPKIRRRIAELRGLRSTNHAFLGAGSDKVIRPSHAYLIRAGTRKYSHHPAYLRHACGMRQVNDVGIVKVNLELFGEGGEGGESGRFSLRVDEVRLQFSAVGHFLSQRERSAGKEGNQADLSVIPGNPTRTLSSLAYIRAKLDYEPFKGTVVVDEAYIRTGQQRGIPCS